MKFMRIYFSGIGGVAIGPLAQIAHDAGYQIIGSDSQSSLMTEQLQRAGVEVSFDQSGDSLEKVHQAEAIDWFCYTAALPADHPELKKAQELGIRVTKRDELIDKIIKEKNLQLIAVAGTHGKTTTTGMLIWTLEQLKVPISYAVGSTLSFGPSGKYDLHSQFFIYECDEFDRNFLHFRPYLSLVTSIDYDHPDTYPSRENYQEAFRQFIAQSSHTIMWPRDSAGNNLERDSLQEVEAIVNDLQLPGLHNRENASLVIEALDYLEVGSLDKNLHYLNLFPGTNRRFERLLPNLYSDYGHHPKEIKATLQMARELANEVVLVYQPHQNARQHRVKDQYLDAFKDAKEVYWLPTYLTREDDSLAILTGAELTANIANQESIKFADLNDKLWQEIEKKRHQGALVLLMGAGSIDGWARNQIRISS